MVPLPGEQSLQANVRDLSPSPWPHVPYALAKPMTCCSQTLVSFRMHGMFLLPTMTFLSPFSLVSSYSSLKVKLTRPLHFQVGKTCCSMLHSPGDADMN